MKRAILNILVFGIVATLSLSCEREAEDSSASVFYINPPSFNNSNGTKTYWNDDGLWWNQDGSDYINVNGADQNFYLKKTGEGNSKWKAIAANSQINVEPINDYYYVCYVGGSGGSVSFNSTNNNNVFSGVDISGIVPLVGVSKTPEVTLKPCCAVLRIFAGESLKNNPIKVEFTQNSNKYYVLNPSGTYNINVDDYKIVANAGNVDQIISSIGEDGYANIVIPMYTDYIECSLIIKDDEFYSISEFRTSHDVRINKGYVYLIDATEYVSK